MNCFHTNVPGYLFCATCGEKLARDRCRCGFIALSTDQFCGGCGLAIGEETKKNNIKPSALHALYDLTEIAGSLRGFDTPLNTTVTNVTQDDIERLLQQSGKDKA